MRRLLTYLLLLIVLVVGGAVGAFYLAPSSMIAGFAQDAVRDNTGRELTLSGDIERSLFPTLGVKTGPITLSNTEWAGEEPMVSADAVTVGVDFMSLLGGSPHVTELRLIKPEIRLARNADGVANWEFDDQTASAAGGDETSGGGDGAAGGDGDAGGGGGGGFSISEAVIEDGLFLLDDQAGGQQIELTQINATAGLPDLEAPFALDGSAIWNGQTVTLKGSVDSPAKAQRGETITSDLDLVAPGLSFTYAGDVTPPEGDGAPQAEGDLALNLSADRQETAWLRQSLPPDLEGLGGVEITGALKAANDGLNIDLNGGFDLNGRASVVKLLASGGSDWATGGTINVDMNVESPELVTTRFDGTVAMSGEIPTIKGDFAFDSPKIRDLADWVGAGPIDAPAGSFETLSIDTSIDVTPERAALEGATIDLSGTNVNGDIVADLTGERPYVNIDVSTGARELRPFMLDGGGQGGSGQGGGAQTAAGAAGGGTAEGWSKDPIDVSALNSADADFTILADSVTTPTVKLGKTLIEGALKNGKLDVSFKELSLYGGGANGVLSLDGGGSEPKVDIDMLIDKVALRPLLSELANFSSLDGVALVELDVDGQGVSLDAIMRSLNGQGRIDFADGAIYGINIPAMMRNLTGSFSGEDQKTDFASLTGSFTIENGVANNPDLSLLGPLLRMTGAGTIDIGNQTLDYRLEPKAVASLEGQGGAAGLGGLSFPVIVSGPWTNLGFQPDLGGGIEGLLENPEGALEAIEGLGEGGVEGVIDSLTGGGDGDGDGGGVEGAIGGVLDNVLGGQEGSGDGDAAPDPGKALRGLFGD